MPWADAVLADRQRFDERLRTFPGGFFWDEAVQESQQQAHEDLDARALFADPTPGDSQRDATIRRVALRVFWGFRASPVCIGSPTKPRRSDGSASAWQTRPRAARQVCGRALRSRGWAVFLLASGSTDQVPPRPWVNSPQYPLALDGSARYYHINNKR
jgi:hypothetical protein